MACGNFKNNAWNTRDYRDVANIYWKRSGIGAVGDIALFSPGLEKSFCKFLAGEPLIDEIDPDPREPSDNNRLVGILSHACPTKLQLTMGRRLAQQASGLLRLIVTEQRNRSSRVHTVGENAQGIIPQQYTGEKEYDKKLSSERRKVQE